MKAFMLGWEFPPFISGGLGTACYGLTKAMGQLGMQIAFVLPKAGIGGYTGPVKVMSAEGNVEIKEASEFENVSFHEIISPLRPYVDSSRHEAYSGQRGSYRERNARYIRSWHSKSAEQGENYPNDMADQVQRYATKVMEIATVEDFDLIHAQATINFADDEELLALAAKAGCRGVFIGFESPTPEGLREIGKKFNFLKGRDFLASVRRIQRHNILVMGSFIIGLDIDEPGIGRRIPGVARQYGVDNLNVLFLTPLPGTRLWDQMTSQDRIALNTFPQDWKYYTLTFPVARYKHLSLDGIIQEMISCNRDFYSMPRILRRVRSSLWQRRRPLISLVSNLSYRNNLRLDCRAYADFKRYSDSKHNRYYRTSVPLGVAAGGTC